MYGNTYWSDFYHRVLILEFTKDWCDNDYSHLIKESVNMLNYVRHKVAIVIDFSHSNSGLRTTDTYPMWLETIQEWRKTSSYADFWITVNPSPCEHIVLWTIGLVYNPTNIVMNCQYKACQVALKKLNAMQGSS